MTDVILIHVSHIELLEEAEYPTFIEKLIALLIIDIGVRCTENNILLKSGVLSYDIEQPVLIISACHTPFFSEIIAGCSRAVGNRQISAGCVVGIHFPASQAEVSI